MEEEVCVICKEGFQEIPAVRANKKGLKILIWFSTERELMIYPVRSINCSLKLCYSFYLLLSLRLCCQRY